MKRQLTENGPTSEHSDGSNHNLHEKMDKETLVFIPQPSTTNSPATEDDRTPHTKDNFSPNEISINSTHPFGIQPEGNKWFSEISSIRESGLGLFSAFDDEFICDQILPFFDEASLLNLQQCSKACYAIVNGFDVEIWKERCVGLSNGDFIYQWRWKHTYMIEYQLRHPVDPTVATIPEKYINMYNKYPTIDTLQTFIDTEKKLYEQNESTDKDIGQNNVFPNPLQFVKTYPPQLLHIYPTYESSLPKIDCTGYFSDALFQPWVTIATFHANKDKWRKEYNIERVDINSITPDQFNAQYSLPGKPVVLTNVTTNWPAVKDNQWTVPTLLGPDYTRLGMTYTCGIGELTMDKYLLYAHRCNDDDTPMYLFDKRFGEKNPHVLEQYTYPEHFSECFFEYLENHPRPPFRWWLVGPARSGSTYHCDPLLTQAQNMMTTGLKKWILYPPHIVPPGITASVDNLQVTAPFNVTEWFVSFYHQTQLKPSQIRNKPTFDDGAGEDALQYDHVIDYPKQCNSYEHYKPVEILQHPGETVFVPATWWHMVINLEFGIAVTQNQVNEGNFIQCEKFLKKIEQPTLRQDLLDGVEKKYPGMHARCEAKTHTRITKLQAYQNRLKALSGQEEKKFAVSVKKELIQIFNQQKACNEMDTGNIVNGDSGFSFGW